METANRLAQEGTLASEGHTGDTGLDHSGSDCRAVNDVLTRVGDKWSMRVVMSLGGGSMRFNNLRRSIDGISQRMLTRTLRGLERDGLVSRTVTPTIPPRVDYALMGLGHSLLEPVNALGGWAIAHREEIEAARHTFDAMCEEK